MCEAERCVQHHQAHSSLTDLDKAPRCHQFETLRRNFWNRARRFFRDFWLLDPHLSRKDVCTGACKLAKISLESEKDCDKLRVAIVKQAKTAFLIKTIVEPKDHLADADGIAHFKVECETASMDLLKGCLVKKHVEVNCRQCSLFFPGLVEKPSCKQGPEEGFFLLA